MQLEVTTLVLASPSTSLDSSSSSSNSLPKCPAPAEVKWTPGPCPASGGPAPASGAGQCGAPPTLTNTTAPLPSTPSCLLTSCPREECRYTGQTGHQGWSAPFSLKTVSYSYKSSLGTRGSYKHNKMPKLQKGTQW